MAYPTSGYGYAPPAPQKPRITPLTAAAAGGPSQVNPYGFQVAKNNAVGPPSAAPIAKPATAATRPVVAKAPVTSLPPVNPAAVQPSAPPTPGTYDINTDPSLQATTALTGLSNDQATAEALKQKQQTLLDYGDPSLIQSVLGDSNLAQAAAASPTSTLASLGQQRDRNETSLTEGLNQDNLLYSGYRVTQEQQAAQDYQSALAQAAAAVNGNLDSISGNLSSTLNTNQQGQIAAEQAARDRAVQDAIANGTGGASPLAAAAAGNTGAVASPAVGPPAATAGTPIPLAEGAAPIPSVTPAQFSGVPVVNDTIGQVPTSVLAQVAAQFGKQKVPANTAQIRRNSL